MKKTISLIAKQINKKILLAFLFNTIFCKIGEIKYIKQIAHINQSIPIKFF